MQISTADLYDTLGAQLQVLELPLESLGGHPAFFGVIATAKAFEDNSKVRAMLSQPGEGRVLVVDGGGSRRFALVGDRIAQLAIDHGWAGIVVHGCVRDAAILKTMPLGILALGRSPRKTTKRDSGLTEVPVHFGGVSFEPGHWLAADEDGVVVAKSEPEGFN